MRLLSLTQPQISHKFISSPLCHGIRRLSSTTTTASSVTRAATATTDSTISFSTSSPRPDPKIKRSTTANDSRFPSSSAPIKKSSRTSSSRSLKRDYIHTNSPIIQRLANLYIRSRVGKAQQIRTSMAWASSGKTNSELIQNLYRNGLIRNERVRRAMMNVDRAHYCPTAPYMDSPQSIGYHATISAPHMHASASEALLPLITGARVTHGRAPRILDVGSGSGYLTHVLANLGNGADGDQQEEHQAALGNGHSESTVAVVGVEHIPELAELARTNMAKSDQGRKMLESGQVKFVVGDGRLGYKDSAPYDAIHVGAAAKELHQELVEQLASPGRLFIPVEDKESGGGGGGWFLAGGEQYIWVIDKDEDGRVSKQRKEGVRYVPLGDRPGI